MSTKGNCKSAPCCCDQCHIRLDCGGAEECCNCIPKRVCVSLVMDSAVADCENCGCSRATGVFEFDCYHEGYTGTLSCGELAIDFLVKPVKAADGCCHWALQSTCLEIDEIATPSGTVMRIPSEAGGDPCNASGPTCCDFSLSWSVDAGKCGNTDCGTGTLTMTPADVCIPGLIRDCEFGCDCVCFPRCLCVSYYKITDVLTGGADCVYCIDEQAACWDESQNGYVATMDCGDGYPTDILLRPTEASGGGCVLEIVEGPCAGTQFSITCTDRYAGGMEGSTDCTSDGGDTVEGLAFRDAKCGDCYVTDGDCPECCASVAQVDPTASCDGENLTITLIESGCSDVDGRSWELTLGSAGSGPGGCQQWAGSDDSYNNLPTCQTAWTASIYCETSDNCNQGGDPAYNYRLHINPGNSGCDWVAGPYHPRVATCEPFFLEFDLGPLVSQSPATDCECCVGGDIVARITK